MADALPTPFDGIEVVVGPVSVRLPKNTMPKRMLKTKFSVFSLLSRPLTSSRRALMD
jgi:hypothetical protein